MDLESNVHHLQLREYLDKVAKYRHQPVYTISLTALGQSRPLPFSKTAAAELAPGQYRTDRDFPCSNKLEEHVVGALTRSARVKATFMPSEERITYRDVDKVPGPGTYSASKPGCLSMEHKDPRWTIPESGKSTGRALPMTKSAADHLGPGYYPVKDPFKEISRSKSAKFERAARNNKEHWAAKEWSNVFRCMKPKPPKSSSVPSLPPAVLKQH
eukprot:TRINITY_DN4414_c0_g3_i3.p1 TRINITY_DN4414_c0_g3~~TRINITY_DN4414_c0_g3_i3.p1  ORF type:complete len:214 (-),score=41.85 TRINITY_DN4414_c0_g3_i3:594-1235(-)